MQNLYPLRSARDRRGESEPCLFAGVTRGLLIPKVDVGVRKARKR